MSVSHKQGEDFLCGLIVNNNFNNCPSKATFYVSVVIYRICRTANTIILLTTMDCYGRMSKIIVYNGSLGRMNNTDSR